MSKISKISGFPEWLPNQKLLEDKFINIIREVYESYGFVPIETPAVELITTLQSKGVIDKEIYILRRAKQEEGEDSDLALHFDLTVPFARYVAMHFNELTFPFKRYQLQKVWRGERPQKGRFREFYQFDIDTIAQDELPLACDAEIVSAIGDVFSKLDIGKFKIRLNSRKMLHGLYEGLGLDEPSRKAAIIAVDKLDKIGKEGVVKELLSAGIKQKVADSIIKNTDRKYSPELFESNSERWLNEKESTTLFREGVKEISELLKYVAKNARDNISVDPGLARGLDYYTGLIFEVVFEKFPEFGSVCSGGRYEDLASQFIKKKLPGVGVSIGLSRLMEMVFTNNIVSYEDEGKVKALVAVYNESQREECNRLAEGLRALNIACEVYYKSPKLGKQIEYAASKKIPNVIFINHENGAIEMKNIKSKNQAPFKNITELAASLT